MIIALLMLLPVVSPLTGTWRLQGDQLKETHHLVIRSESEIELYNSEWYPFDVRSVEVEGNRFRVEAFHDLTPHSFFLEGELDDGKLNGTLKVPDALYQMEAPLTGIRVVDRPISQPVETISRFRSENGVDVLGFILDRGPRSSESDFRDFWNREVMPNFYIFFEPLLEIPEGDSAETGPAVVNRIFAALPAYDRLRAAGIPPAESTDKKPATTVLLPQLTEAGPGPEKTTETRLQLAAVKRDYPAGQEPCCGSKRYDVQSFRLVIAVLD